MGFRQILPVGALALEKIRDGIQPETVYPHLAPKIDDPEYLFLNQRIIIIQIGLVMKKAVPVILPGYRIPGPVGMLKVLENDPDIFVLLGIVCPDIESAFFGIFRRQTRALKPGMRIRGMI